MRNDFYAQGTVRLLLNTDLITSNTKDVLNERLGKPAVVDPLFFNKKDFITLTAICKRLIPQQREEQVDLPGMLDEQFTTDSGNGWRYAVMPDDKKTMMKGLVGINETAGLMFGEAFHLLDGSLQDEVLRVIQSGAAMGMAWQQLPAALFFEELLTMLVELYYSHPLAKEEIGETAMADAKGWNEIGLNELEEHEPRPINYPNDR